MATGTIVASWQEGEFACLAVRVAEAGGDVEYIGRLPVAELADLSNAQKKARLVAAVKAVRGAQRGTSADLGLSGVVSL